MGVGTKTKKQDLLAIKGKATISGLKNVAQVGLEPMILLPLSLQHILPVHAIIAILSFQNLKFPVGNLVPIIVVISYVLHFESPG